MFNMQLSESIKNDESDFNIDELKQAIEEGEKKCYEYYIGEFNGIQNKKETISAFVLQGDGLYEVKENKLAVFTFKKKETNIPGLPIIVSEGVELKIPKIPIKMYKQLLEFYRHIHSLYRSEVYVIIYYDPINNNFFFYVPKQDVGSAHATYSLDVDEIHELNKQYIKVAETHSHHTMGGSFSSIDDAEQKIPNILHLVIGNITTNPTYQIRVKYDTQSVYLKLNELFEDADEDELDLSLFPDWETNVQKSEFRTKTYKPNYESDIEYESNFGFLNKNNNNYYINNRKFSSFDSHLNQTKVNWSKI